MDDQRYHLTLSADDAPTMHGWWADRSTAERKFTTWVGEFGAMPDARVVLVDEEAGVVLTSWPDEA